jgi:hypothetical protein
MRTSNMFKTLMIFGFISLIFPAVSMAEESEVEKIKEPKKGMKPAMLEKYDADKDGMLSEDEKAIMKADKEAAKAKMLEKFDSDGDGVISDDEKAAMKEAKMKAKEAVKEAVGVDVGESEE